MSNDELIAMLEEKVGADGPNTEFYELKVEGLSFLKLRDILIDIGKIAFEDTENNIYIAEIKGGKFGKNPALVALELNETGLHIVMNSKEGVIDQKTNQDVIKRIENALEGFIIKKDEDDDTPKLIDNDGISKNAKFVELLSKYKIYCIAVVIVVLLIIVILIIRAKDSGKNESIADSSENESLIESDIIVEDEPNIEDESNIEGESDMEDESVRDEYKSLCKEYNEIIEQYNVKAVAYNNLIIKLSDYNISGLPESVDTKETLKEDYNLFTETGSDIEAFRKEIESIAVDDKSIAEKYNALYTDAYNQMIDRYNVVGDEYNKLRKISSIDYIDSMPYNIVKKPYISDQVEDINETNVNSKLDTLYEEMNVRASQYVVIKQITNPSVTWVKERLKSVNQIEGQREVTSNNDPNGLLGKEGGYTGCVYFNIKK